MQLVQTCRYSFTLRAALQYLNISLNSKCLRYLAEEGNIIIDAQMFGVFFKPNFLHLQVLLLTFLINEL